MLKHQWRTLKQALTMQATRVRQNYLSRSYLGDLPKVVTLKALEKINQEYRYAKAAIPAPHRHLRPLNNCKNDCTVSQQFGIPCRHKVYYNLVNGEPLKKWHVHHHWHLKRRLVSTPHLFCMAKLTMGGSR